jgi:hypothetical protein
MAMMRRTLLYAGLSTVLALALVSVDYLALRAANRPLVPHHYYMALGDSLSFGYQPDFNFTAGFADDIFTFLQKANVTDEENLACAGETTTSMLQGGCVGRFVHHGFYTGAQLDAAVAFLRGHPGQVSPITLEIGANDVIPDWDQATCTAGPTSDADLKTMDTNIGTILDRLLAVLSIPSGHPSGNLHILTYYNPFARVCPNSVTFVHQLDDHITADARARRVSVIDIYSAFGGDAGMAQSVCEGNIVNGVHDPWTWICNAQFHDIHPTTDGYAVIAQAVENGLALPGAPPLVPNIFPTPMSVVPGAAPGRRTDL